MAQQNQSGDTGTSSSGKAAGKRPTGDEHDDEPEAEQESAAAMDSDVPQPPDASKTTEGQPS